MFYGCHVKKKVKSVRKSLKIQYLDDCFNTSSGPDIGIDIVGLSAISGAMLLTILLNFGLEEVSDILIDPECPTSSQLD